jgi:hypothetical protein
MNGSPEYQTLEDALIVKVITLIEKKPRIIKLTQGKTTLVDEEDFAYLNQWKWCARKQKSGHYYAVRTANENGHRETIMMHRLY